MTVQQMIDTAIEEGAASEMLWTMNRVERYAVKFTDVGNWYFVDATGDHRIDETDARRLLDCFQIGYID